MGTFSCELRERNPEARLAACLGVGLAWHQEADYFAMFFAAAAAIAGVTEIISRAESISPHSRHSRRNLLA